MVIFFWVFGGLWALKVIAGLLRDNIEMWQDIRNMLWKGKKK